MIENTVRLRRKSGSDSRCTRFRAAAWLSWSSRSLPSRARSMSTRCSSVSRRPMVRNARGHVSRPLSSAVAGGPALGASRSDIVRRMNCSDFCERSTANRAARSRASLVGLSNIWSPIRVEQALGCRVCRAGKRGFDGVSGRLSPVRRQTGVCRHPGVRPDHPRVREGATDRLSHTVAR